MQYAGRAYVFASPLAGPIGAAAGISNLPALNLVERASAILVQIVPLLNLVQY